MYSNIPVRIQYNWDFDHNRLAPSPMDLMVMVMRLSLGRQSVNLFASGQTDYEYPISFSRDGVVDRPCGFFGHGFESDHPPITNFYGFAISNLKNTLPGTPRKCNRVDMDTSTRISGRPAIPPCQGGCLL